MANVRMAKGAWADLAISGTILAVRITPNARQNTLTREADGLRCTVTAALGDDRVMSQVRR